MAPQSAAKSAEAAIVLLPTAEATWAGQCDGSVFEQCLALGQAVILVPEHCSTSCPWQERASSPCVSACLPPVSARKGLPACCCASQSGVSLLHRSSVQIGFTRKRREEPATPPLFGVPSDCPPGPSSCPTVPILPLSLCACRPPLVFGRPGSRGALSARLTLGLLQACPNARRSRCTCYLNSR